MLSITFFLLSAVSAIPAHLPHTHFSIQKRTLTPDNTCGAANGYICNPNDPYGGSCCSASGWCGESSVPHLRSSKTLLNFHRKLRGILRYRMSVGLWKLCLLCSCFCISATLCHSASFCNSAAPVKRASSARDLTSTQQRGMHVGSRWRRQLYALADL